MSLVTRLLPDNPVLTKELRVRMRGARAYWILFGYLGFLSFVLLAAYGAWQSRIATSGGSGSSEVSQVGSDIFTYMVITQMFLVLFITPAITSGSLTLEKEQRTMEMLTMTRMPRRSIINGKLLSALSFTALLLISSLPLVSLCFMLGSIDPAMVVSTYLMLLFGSLLIGSMGLMWSSIAKSTTAAVLYTYGTLFVLFTLCAPAYGSSLGQFGGSLGENVLRSIGLTLFGNVFLGIHSVEGFGFALMCLLSSLLMAAVAMSRLEMFPERRAKLLRSLTLLVFGVFLLAVDYWWIANWYHRSVQAVMMPVQAPIAVLIVTALLLMAIIPTFATGELTPYEARRFAKYLLRGWSPQGLTRGKLASGLPFLLLFTLTCLAVFVFAFVLVGKPGDFTRAARLAAPISITPPPVQGGIYVRGQLVTQPNMPPVPPSSTPKVVNPPAGYTQSIGDFTQAAVMLLAFTVGFSLLCLLLSIAFRNRWVAWFLAYVFLLVLWIAPEQGRAPINDGMPPGIGVYLYYLNPVQALFQMAEPNNFWNYNRQLPTSSAPMWLDTSIAWLALGGLCLLLSLPFVVRERKRTAVIPYEELVAET